MGAENITASETRYQVDEVDAIQATPKVFQGDVLESDWDTECTNFVKANQHVLVDCPWQSGVEMTLSAVTLGWPVPIRAYNVDSVFAQLRKLLADKLEPTTMEPDENPELELDNVADDAQMEEQPNSAPKPVMVDTMWQPSPAYMKPNQQTVLSEEVTHNPLTVTPPLASLMASIDYTNEASYQSAVPYATPSNPTTVRKPTELQTIKAQLIVEAQEPPIELDYIEVTDDTYRIIDQAPLPSAVREIDRLVMPIDQLEESSVYAEITAAVLTPAQIPKSIGPVLLEEGQYAIYDNGTKELDDTLEAEGIMRKIAESAQQSKIDIAHKIHEIIDKIIERPSVYQENIVDEERVLEEVTELLTELIEMLNIDYTPKLLVSLARQILKTRFELALEDLDTSVENIESAQRSFVSQVIQQLTVTLALLKASIDRACAIGKSALAHFGLSLASSDI